MPQKNKYPIIRITTQANKRADEIVSAFLAQGIETSKTSLVSELILSMPIPQPQAVEKRARKVAVSTSAGAVS